MVQLQPFNQPLSIGELFREKQVEWDLSLVAGEAGLERQLETAELNRPGLALAGYYEVFSNDRIQIIGLTESSFLKSLDHEARAVAVKRTLSFNIPCVIVTTDQEVCRELAETCDERAIPLLRTSHITSPFQYDLGHFLERRLAPCYTVHGVMMDVFGMGVLIQGQSGVGKSECGLELIERGHRLIADDVVIVRRVARDELYGEPPPNIGYHMEIRGIGIIDVELLYGVRAVRDEAPIKLMVTMEPWDSNKEYERLGLSNRDKMLFECPVPEYILPVEPGRNIAKLVEVAALTQRLEDQGINVAQEFEQQIMDAIQHKSDADRPPRAIDRLKHARPTG